MVSKASDPSSDKSAYPAFPAGMKTIRLVFPEKVDPESSQRPEHYTTESGLKVLEAQVDVHDPTIVTLTTEPMNGQAMIIDRITAKGIQTAKGALRGAQSREFVHGIASLPGIQWPASETFPYQSRFIGRLACGSCQKDGGVNSNHLIDQLGFSFIHVEKGGPFNSLKVVGQKHVPGIEAEVEKLAPRGLSPHVLWSGGEIQTVDGETRLVDTGHMQGSILPATPKLFPPPFRITAADITGDAAKGLKAKSLQGVIVRFDEVTIDSFSEPNNHDDWVSAPHLRSFVFHDASGHRVRGLLLKSVTREMRPGLKFDTLRALLHQPRLGHYEAIVELNEHLNYQAGFGNRIYESGEGGSGFRPD